MILLLGASGYVGQAFERELKARKQSYIPLSRSQLDYTDFDHLLGAVKKTRPSFVINVAGFTGKPNVDACETARAETLIGNTLFPQTVAHVCSVMNVPWGHVSSGCIYTGAKIVKEEGVTVEPDLMRPDVERLLETDRSVVRGFTEEDIPNFSFRHPPCSFYSGTKALAEEALANASQTYIWRLRIPFDEWDNPRNYLSKIQNYARVYNNVNSLSHRGDFAKACLDLWERKAPFGIYNVTNPGFVTTRQVVEMIQRKLKPAREFEFWADDEEFYRKAAKTPRSNCVLDVSKLLAAGVKVRPVEEAIEHSLDNWKPIKD